MIGVDPGRQGIGLGRALTVGGLAVARGAWDHHGDALRRRRQRRGRRPLPPRSASSTHRARPRVRSQRPGAGVMSEAGSRGTAPRAARWTRSSPDLGRARVPRPPAVGRALHRCAPARRRHHAPPRASCAARRGVCPSRSISSPSRRRTDDMTTKWLWACNRDGAQIETVLMRIPDAATVCVSSQAGCAMACTFCATGQAGFERHLDAGEIVEQVMRAAHASPQRVRNVVFMGMGEPLANYDATWAAIERLHDDVGISARRITVSTVGVVPGIRRLASERLPVTLAVSLHASHRRATQRAGAAQPPLPDRRGARRGRGLRRCARDAGSPSSTRASPASTTHSTRPRRWDACWARSPVPAAPT